MNSRQQTILQMVIDQGQVSVTDLAKATGVSEVTIRQDLNTLEKLSYLRRAHGFAVSLDSDDVETRMMSNYTLKRELAEFAASLVQPGETIFIENGSSNALLARTLGEQKKKLMTDEQLFEAFFVRKKGESPDDEDRELFRRAVNKEELL